jgi:PRC-barrel domain protein
LLTFHSRFREIKQIRVKSTTYGHFSNGTVIAPQEAKEWAMSTELCYLEAGKVQGRLGDLEGMTLSSDTDEALGTLDGVVIDPAERRLRYFVVQRRGWLRSRRYLVPADQPAQISDDSRTLRVPVHPAQLAACEEFDGESIPEFSDDHLITALFGHDSDEDEDKVHAA